MTGSGSQLFVSLSRVERGDMQGTEIADALRGCIADMRLALDTLTPDEQRLPLGAGRLPVPLAGSAARRPACSPAWTIDVPDGALADLAPRRAAAAADRAGGADQCAEACRGDAGPGAAAAGRTACWSWKWRMTAAAPRAAGRSGARHRQHARARAAAWRPAGTAQWRQGDLRRIAGSRECGTRLTYHPCAPARYPPNT